MIESSEIFTIEENSDNIRCQYCWLEFLKGEKYIIISSSGQGLFPDGAITFPIHKICKREQRCEENIDEYFGIIN